MPTSSTATPNGINPPFPAQPIALNNKLGNDALLQSSSTMNGPGPIMNGQQQPVMKQQATNQIRIPGFLEGTADTLPIDTPSSNTAVASRQQSAPVQSAPPVPGPSQPIDSNLEVSELIMLPFVDLVHNLSFSIV